VSRASLARRSPSSRLRRRGDARLPPRAAAAAAAAAAASPPPFPDVPRLFLIRSASLR